MGEDKVDQWNSLTEKAGAKYASSFLMVLTSFLGFYLTARSLNYSRMYLVKYIPQVNF